MDQHKLNVANAPKTSTFQMRINPEIKQQVENIYSRQGLTFTDAVNIFIQQSINTNGLPFLASPENEEYMKAKAMHRLMEEGSTVLVARVINARQDYITVLFGDNISP